uniref:Reverse transcriptase domain-containing protein n=1 Tax=Cannabis sativa TaxID=3483 RepID=A0A803P436_CANSA
MAKTRSKVQGKLKTATKLAKKRGSKGKKDANNSISMEQISKIEALEVSEEEDLVENDPALKDVFQPPLSPKSSLARIQRQEEVCSDFVQFLHANDQCNSAIAQGKNSIPPVLRSTSVVRNLDNSFKQSGATGVNPPLHVLDGFVHRIWKGKERERLSYARVLIEVLMDQPLPDMVEFENEFGWNTSVGIRVERMILWKDLMGLNTTDNWFLMRDFNDILSKEERVGHRVKFHPDNEFLNFVKSCQLEDIKASGNFFTSSNKQHGDERIFYKIDRVLANKTWIDKYDRAEVVFLNEGLFDHTPVILSLHPEVVSGKKPFKYFKMWKSHPKYENGLKELHSREKNAREKSIKSQRDYASFLQQKPKVAWLQSGDYNTALFHACIKQRQRQNRILSIEKLDGIRVNEASKIIDAFLEFYNSLLGTRMENRRKIEKSILTRGPILTVDNGRMLTQQFTSDDVKKPIFSMPRKKSLGPDGYSRNFFQDNWEYIGEDISAAVLSFLESDLVRHYGRKANKQSCMIKLDLQKAYDTIEWDFIEEVLTSLNFPHSIIRIVMNWISTPKFSLMLNGALHGFFESKRGLRQRDPMFPLLFVLGMEYLSRLMGKIGEKEDFYFHNRCASLILNHLAFADDVLLFCHGDLKSVMYMLQALKLFSIISDLHPNPSKTAIYCSNLDQGCVNKILQLSGYMRQNLPFTYQGIPICAKKIPGKECEILAEKMMASIRSWSSRNLSFAGRITLINSVLITIPAYWSQIVILPKKILKAIESIC